MGVNYLIKNLNVNLVMHIKKSLPYIRNNLIELIHVMIFKMFYSPNLK